MAENSEIKAQILAALDAASDRDDLSVQTVIGAEIAETLGVRDPGKVRVSHRAFLRSLRLNNPAAVYRLPQELSPINTQTIIIYDL